MVRPSGCVTNRAVTVAVMSETAAVEQVTPEQVVFEPIGRETLSGRIREQLYERISTGELHPGARIPSERALSEQFRVARTSVREAIQGLVSLGVIERRGNRSYVAEQLPDVTLTATDDDRKAFVRDRKSVV